jgi:hypothetical protein
MKTATILPFPATPSTPALEKQRREITALAEQTRNEIVQTIRAALRKRSGKPWSVTGGTGTAWGWIKISAPPARRTLHARLKAGAASTSPEDYEMVDTGEPDGNLTEADCLELARLLGLESVSMQGESVPATTAFRRVAIARALFGSNLGFEADRDWD